MSFAEGGSVKNRSDSEKKPDAALYDIYIIYFYHYLFLCDYGARCSSLVRALGRRIDPSWGEPIELFLVPASAPRLV